MEEMWNDRYKSNDYFYGIEPNPSFKQFLDKCESGKILLPGEGEGRNAVYAAKLAWDVTAVDFSKEGRNKALTLAKKSDVSINYELKNIIEYTPEPDSFDCIALLFLHMPEATFVSMLHHLISGLKTGGKLFICGFHTSQLKYSSGGPKNEDWLYSATKLQDQIKNVDIILNQQFEIELNEGDGHRGLASMLRYEAIKK